MNILRGIILGRRDLAVFIFRIDQAFILIAVIITIGRICKILDREKLFGQFGDKAGRKHWPIAIKNSSISWREEVEIILSSSDAYIKETAFFGKIGISFGIWKEIFAEHDEKYSMIF